MVCALGSSSAEDEVRSQLQTSHIFDRHPSFGPLAALDAAKMITWSVPSTECAIELTAGKLNCVQTASLLGVRAKSRSERSRRQSEHHCGV